MSQETGSGGYWGAAGQGVEGRQPGSRRERWKGYLRAANELRQEVMANYSAGWDNRDSRAEHLTDGTPGAFPDAAVIRGGDEEMILFPSYARKHVKTRPPNRSTSQLQTSGDGYPTSENDYWKQRWEEYEDDNAVVDVDVRGWVFSPHKGPMTRRQRLYLSAARQLAGLTTATKAPADSPQGSRASSPQPPRRERFGEKLEEHASRHEAEAVLKEAERIQVRGEAEAEIARRGGYSEVPQSPSSKESFYRTHSSERSSRQGTNQQLRQLAARNNSVASDDERSITPLQKRDSWPQPADMNPDQMSLSNAHLLARMKPFFSAPIANAPISAFFYNEDSSRQRTIYTNASGHFALRAALDFVPTHVRILASENLSATEEVTITETQGITVISDIDDTIKHTSMMSGAREAFRNAFIRDLADLSIQGVKEWYTRLSKLGVKFHYVSNSPWQLYPTLTKYMSLAGLPPGSVHLKLYSGMLQGIFEPVAERKKSTMDRLAQDFPDRKFILIGDSGEADLEVYTDFAMENPGKVLAVYIRDVTTSPTTGFFDGSMSSLDGNRNGGPRRSAASTRRLSNTPATGANLENDPDLKAALEASLREFALEETRRRPEPPVRMPSDPQAVERTSAVGDLITFDDDETPLPANPRLPRSLTDPISPPAAAPLTDSSEPSESGSRAVQRSIPPMPPRKPVALRGSKSDDHNPTVQPVQARSDSEEESRERKRPPPKPRRSSTSVKNYEPRSASPLATRKPQREENSEAGLPRPPARQSSYTSLAKQKLTSAYNRLPPAPSMLSSAPREQTRRMSSHRDSDAGPDLPPRRTRGDADNDGRASDARQKPPPPPPPPRRGLTAYPAAAAQYASNRVSTAWNSYNNPSNDMPSQAGGVRRSGSPGSSTSPSANKREDLWRRRWTRAESILRERGVVLRSWRVGGDVADECVGLVEKALKEMGIQPKSER